MPVHIDTARMRKMLAGPRVTLPSRPMTPAEVLAFLDGAAAAMEAMGK